MKEKHQLYLGKQPLTLSHLDKVFWPEEGYTKGDLLEYYEKISPIILPYLKERPLVLRRQPNGVEDTGFYQKNIENLPPEISQVSIEHEKRTVHYMMANNKTDLLYAANLGCIEMHPFLSRVEHLDRPDFLVLDLDPVDISFDHVLETALVIHEILENFKIKSYCKTSGSRGLHILVPLKARYDFEQSKRFGELVATLTHEQLPKITSLERSPAKRQRKVYIDYLQNNRGQTIVAPYSVRGKPHAPVSTPLEWDELKPGIKPTDFTIKNTFNRLSQMGDIFKPVLKQGANLEKALKV
jgi:bifunctional non-homologous end joining protein LigD